jgi:ABC-type multidrug transport system fused ATPase/permease subunit
LNEVYIAKNFQGIQNVAQAVAGLICAFVYSWRATLACFIGFPLCGLIYWIGNFFVGKTWLTFNKSTTDSVVKAEQVITAFRTVKSFDNETMETEKYRVSLGEIRGVFDKISLIIGTKNCLILLVTNAMLIGFLYFSSWMIVRRPNWGMENGDLMVMVSCIIFCSIGVTQALTIIDDFQRANISAEQIFISS